MQYPIIASPRGNDAAFASSDKFFEMKILPVNPTGSRFCSDTLPPDSLNSNVLNILRTSDQKNRGVTNG